MYTHAHSRFIVLILEKEKRLEMEKKEKELANIQGTYQNIEFGSQIRSYVFCPYTMVKDHRTGHETSDVYGVMDGNIKDFVFEFLKLIN